MTLWHTLKRTHGVNFASVYGDLRTVELQSAQRPSSFGLLTLVWYRNFVNVLVCHTIWIRANPTSRGMHPEFEYDSFKMMKKCRTICKLLFEPKESLSETSTGIGKCGPKPMQSPPLHLDLVPIPLRVPLIGKCTKLLWANTHCIDQMQSKYCYM